MTITDEIIAVANQLANQGKKPSVALVKNKLSQQVPLPLLISTLKNWQHEPERTQTRVINASDTMVDVENTLKENATLSASEINEMLAPIKTELVEIKQLLAQLVNQRTINK